MNNIRRVQNLQRCESLRRLDLSLNFLDAAALPSLRRLAGAGGEGAVLLVGAGWPLVGGGGPLLVGGPTVSGCRWVLARRGPPASPPMPGPCLLLLLTCSLRANEALEELSLLGNPCTRWPGYRPYVLACLPHLQRLDGEQVGRGAGGGCNQPVGAGLCRCWYRRQPPSNRPCSVNAL